MNRCLAAGNLREQSVDEKQAYAASRCKNKGEVVAICYSRGCTMQFPCVYDKSRLEIPMAHNVS